MHLIFTSFYHLHIPCLSSSSLQHLFSHVHFVLSLVAISSTQAQNLFKGDIVFLHLPTHLPRSVVQHFKLCFIYTFQLVLAEFFALPPAACFAHDINLVQTIFIWFCVCSPWSALLVFSPILSNSWGDLFITLFVAPTCLFCLFVISQISLYYRNIFVLITYERSGKLYHYHFTSRKSVEYPDEFFF